jgi:hypothetical protein
MVAPSATMTESQNVLCRNDELASLFLHRLTPQQFFEAECRSHVVMVVLGTTIYEFAGYGALLLNGTRGWSHQVRP